MTAGGCPGTGTATLGRRISAKDKRVVTHRELLCRRTGTFRTNPLRWFLQLINFCREHKIAFGQPVDFVGPNGHLHFAPG